VTGPTCGDPEVLNRKLKLGATTYNIIGVALPEFFGTTRLGVAMAWAMTNPKTMSPSSG
jgi:hypothetical protein